MWDGLIFGFGERLGLGWDEWCFVVCLFSCLRGRSGFGGF